MLIVYEIKAKDFLGKSTIFESDLKITLFFVEMLIVYEIQAKNDFVGKSKIFGGALKILLFLPKC